MEAEGEHDNRAIERERERERAREKKSQILKNKNFFVVWWRKKMKKNS